MYVPFITSSSTSNSPTKRQRFRRKVIKGSRPRLGGSSGSSLAISTASGLRFISSKSSGGGSVATISSGAFAGRSIGGGNRGEVYGTRQYGSGYPGVTGAGVAGRGFPFYFWPVTWGGAAGAGTAAYYHNHRDEYGRPDNSTRPGRAMADATFIVNNSTTYHVVADNTTVTSLVTTINEKCAFITNGNNTLIATTQPGVISPYNDAAPNATKPESVIQYYRASSVALALDGYNNSAVYSNDTNAPDTPLPTTLNTNALDCLNRTIGEFVPLANPFPGGASLNGGTITRGTFNTGTWVVSPGLPGVIALVAVFMHLASS
ncbi:hypothetical protein PQX77_004248 [Marasmius sp. AFHP31]|nr:hypothetical protein PQX77_004248 [Marasmius sp. AFHP31]